MPGIHIQCNGDIHARESLAANETQLLGLVEVGETCIGGKSKNMHKCQRKYRVVGSVSDRTAVTRMKDRKTIYI